MSEYYAVQRSENALSHYGVKGMKWGVRKAIDRGNNRKLAKHYAKASKKLAKLKNDANVGYQNKRIKNATNQQKMAAVFGATNIGLAGGMTLASMTSAKRRALDMAKKTGFGVATANAYLPVGAGIALGDIAARQIGKKKARKLASAEGHKQAVKREREFRNEMQNAFKGTKYARSIDSMANDVAAKKRRRVERNIERYDQMYKNSKIGRIEAYANGGSTNRHGRKRRRMS